MEIGFFGGSFNPIHIGHLIIAEHICNNAGLDELWISVTPKNPLKVDSSLLDEKHRVEMVKRAIERFDKIKYCDIELYLPIPSFTADTLRKLCLLYPEHNFSLIIGADNWLLFDKWREYDFILKNFKIIVYPRPGYDIDAEIRPLTEEQRKRMFNDVEYVETYTKLNDMVQTEILNLVKSKIENTSEGKELLFQQLRIVKRLKSEIINETNKEMELFKRFKEFSKLNPEVTYEEFIKANM